MVELVINYPLGGLLQDYCRFQRLIVSNARSVVSRMVRKSNGLIK